MVKVFFSLFFRDSGVGVKSVGTLASGLNYKEKRNGSNLIEQRRPRNTSLLWACVNPQQKNIQNDQKGKWKLDEKTKSHSVLYAYKQRDRNKR